jgi:hypothetical protein
MARCRPTNARWLKLRSFSPPMSVTSPTLKLLALLDEPVVALVVPLVVPAGALVVVVVVLLLLLPHAASPRASAAKAGAKRPASLILPITASPFTQY